MYSVDFKEAQTKTQTLESLDRQSFIYSVITHYALIRERMTRNEDTVLRLNDVVNGEPTKSEIRFNYEETDELYLFDRLLVPRIQAVLTQAAQLDASPYILRHWSPECLFAVRNGGVKDHDFSGITAILDARKAEMDRMRSQKVVSPSFGQPRYA